MQLVTSLSFIVAVSSDWTRGTYAQLSFTYGPAVTGSPASYNFSFAGSLFVSSPDSLQSATDFSTHSGIDALGSFDALSISFGSDGALGVSYYNDLDAFVFSRAPVTKHLPTSWPFFGNSTQPSTTSRCLGWSGGYMFPGFVKGGASLQDCSSDGPLFIFEAATQTLPYVPRPAMALTPLTNFTSSFVDGSLFVDASANSCERAGGNCALFPNKALLLARPGVGRATRAVGALLRRFYNTTRLRGPGVTQLSMWNDNQGGYSWWSVGPDQMVWGAPEEIYAALVAGYLSSGIPIRGLEADNNFLVDYDPIKNWIGRDLGRFNETLYPSGGPGFVARIGVNTSLDYMVYYTNGFSPDNVYGGAWNMVDTQQGHQEPHPNVSAAFFRALSSTWPTGSSGHVVSFSDFLSFRGTSMRAFQDDLPLWEEGEHQWLVGLGGGAPETQFCMAGGHQILVSLEIQGVTSARVNGDGGLDTPSLVLPSILAGMVGLGWSKDNLRTAERCFVSPRFPNGTVMYPCDAKNHGEGVNGAFVMQRQQTALAAYSLGPVGISDQLSSSPSDPSASITSNLPLVRSTCAATGDLLQPSYPATPVERMVVQAGGFGDCFDEKHRPYTYGCGTNVFATYTALPSQSSGGGGGGGVAIFYSALCFAAGRGQLATEVTLWEVDFAPMVDADSLPSPLLNSPPEGTFQGAGVTFPPDASSSSSSSASRHLVWLSLDFTVSGCEGVSSLQVWAGNVTAPLPPDNSDGVTVVNISPIFPSGLALLGEATKAVAASTFRVASIQQQSDSGGGLVVSIRGLPQESVQLLFSNASASVPTCFVCTVPIGADGSASVIFPGCTQQ